MNAITTLKRSLVISGAALVLAVPAAQAADEPSQWYNVRTLDSSPTAIAAQPTQAPMPPNDLGTQSVRFAHAATRAPQAQTPVTAGHAAQWTNLAIGALVVGLVFSLLYIGASRTQVPPAPRARKHGQTISAS